MRSITMKTGLLGLATIGLGLAFSATTASAGSVPKNLDGKWTCTFENGKKSVLVARVGHTSVLYQYDGGETHSENITTTSDNVMQSHGSGWAWKLTAKGEDAELYYQNLAKNMNFTVPCTKV